MRVIGLDIIRCIAIFLLLFAHIAQELHSPLGNAFGIPDFYWVSLGGVAVTLFLVLSGASLETNYGTKKIRYSTFIFKRLTRIYPAYYMSLILGVMIYLASTHHADISTSDIVLSLTGTYAFFGKWGGPFVPTSWFIGLIVFLYFFFPMLSSWIKKQPLVSILSLLMMSVLSRFVLGSTDILPFRPMDWFPVCRVFEFSLGIRLAMSRKFTTFISIRLPGKIIPIISLLSELSFPLFLIHYPLLRSVTSLVEHGLRKEFSITLFVLASVLISWAVVLVDREIQRFILTAAPPMRVFRN